MSKLAMAIAVTGILAVGGCAALPTYVKEGVSEDDHNSDLDSCTRQAQLLTNREELITQDIRAAREPSLRGGGGDFVHEVEDLAPRRNYENIVGECMTRKGYETERLGDTGVRGLWPFTTK